MGELRWGPLDGARCNLKVDTIAVRLSPPDDLDDVRFAFYFREKGRADWDYGETLTELYAKKNPGYLVVDAVPKKYAVIQSEEGGQVKEKFEVWVAPRLITKES